MNKVILIGNVGQDPEIKTFGEDKRVASLTLATTSQFKDKGGNKKTTWHNLTIWGKLADIAEKYVKKGDKLAVEGEILNETYEKDGVKKYITKINVSNFEMLGNKNGEAKQDTGDGGFKETDATLDKPIDDDLPF